MALVSAIKQEMRFSKSECFQGFSAPHVHFFLIPTRSLSPRSRPTHWPWIQILDTPAWPQPPENCKWSPAYRPPHSSRSLSATVQRNVTSSAVFPPPRCKASVLRIGIGPAVEIRRQSNREDFLSPLTPPRVVRHTAVQSTFRA